MLAVLLFAESFEQSKSMTLHNNQSTYVKRVGREFLYFGGTNYLGVAHRQELINASKNAFENYGFSSGASRLTSGENEILLSLETELARFAQAETAVVLPAGYMANQALVEALDDQIDAWVMPARSHSSIASALKQASKPVLIDESNEIDSTDSWRARLGLEAKRSVAVFAEPIDALTGKIKRIDDLYRRITSSDYLILDEAQSMGVLGESGRGAMQHFLLPSPTNLIRTGTFSKAIGTYGGFVLATQEIISNLKRSSSCYKGSTSLPPLVCAATRASLHLLESDAENTVLKLKQNIELLNNQLLELSKKPNGECFARATSSTPIFYMPYSKIVDRIFEALPKQDIYIPSMASYFPGITEIGLRWTIQSGHTESELQKLSTLFQNLL